MTNIVISYRRQDSINETQRLYDLLSTEFGGDNVFRDLDSVKPGTDFVKRIDRVIGNAEVVLAIIGPSWTSAKDTRGQRRLDNHLDYVRIEIARALGKKKHLIPVLVRGAEMPLAEEVPAELIPILRLHAVELRNEHFNTDLDRLLSFVKDALAEPDSRAEHVDQSEFAAQVEKLQGEVTGLEAARQELEKALADKSGKYEAIAAKLRRSKKLIISLCAITLISVIVTAVTLIFSMGEKDISIITVPEIGSYSPLPGLTRAVSRDRLNEISAQCKDAWASHHRTKIWEEPNLFRKCADEIRPTFKALAGAIKTDIEICKENLNVLKKDDIPPDDQKLELLFLAGNAQSYSGALCYGGESVKHIKGTSYVDYFNGWIKSMELDQREVDRVLKALDHSIQVPRFPVLVSNHGRKNLRLESKADVHADEETLVVRSTKDMTISAGETRRVLFEFDMTEPGTRDQIRHLMKRTTPLEIVLSLVLERRERRVVAQIVP